MRVGRELGLEEAELQNLEVAALLHDIGNVGIPDSISASRRVSTRKSMRS